MQCAVSLTPNMNHDVALRSGEGDEANADDESDDSEYDSRCDHSCASATASSTDSGSGSDDEGGSHSNGDGGSDLSGDHIPGPHSSYSSGNGHEIDHSSDHGSDSGSEWDIFGDDEDDNADYETWFGKVRGERSRGPSDTTPQAEYALGSDFASASVPLNACQGRDEKVRNLKASLYEMTKEKVVCEEHAGDF